MLPSPRRFQTKWQEQHTRPDRWAGLQRAFSSENVSGGEIEARTLGMEGTSVIYVSTVMCSTELHVIVLTVAGPKKHFSMHPAHAWQMLTLEHVSQAYPSYLYCI